MMMMMKKIADKQWDSLTDSSVGKIISISFYSILYIKDNVIYLQWELLLGETGKLFYRWNQKP